MEDILLRSVLTVAYLRVACRLGGMCICGPDNTWPSRLAVHYASQSSSLQMRECQLRGPESDTPTEHRSCGGHDVAWWRFWVHTSEIVTRNASQQTYYVAQIGVRSPQCDSVCRQVLLVISFSVINFFHKISRTYLCKSLPESLKLDGVLCIHSN